MDNHFEVKVLRLAQLDIERIFLWIQERSPGGARRWYNAFLESARSLSTSPHRFGLSPEAPLVASPVRQCFFKTPSGRQYRILYLIVGNEVRILRVRGPGQQLIDSSELTSE